MPHEKGDQGLSASQGCGDTGGSLPAANLEAAPSKYALLCALDFEPAERPEGLIEAVFLADESTRWAAGLYELRYVRALTPEEWKAREYRTLLAEQASQGSHERLAAGSQPQASQPIREEQ